MNKKILLLFVFSGTALFILLVVLVLNSTKSDTNTTPKEEEGLYDILEQEAETHRLGEEHQQTLEEKNKLITFLPYRNPEGTFEVYYKIIDEDAFKLAYPVVLHPKNPSDQNEIQVLKNDVLNWITSKNISAEEIEIEWRIE